MSNVPGIISIYCKISKTKGTLAAIQNIILASRCPLVINIVCDNNNAVYHNISDKQYFTKYRI